MLRAVSDRLTFKNERSEDLAGSPNYSAGRFHLIQYHDIFSNISWYRLIFIFKSALTFSNEKL